MEYVFLFAIVTPLALLILNLIGFRAGDTPAALAFEAPAAPLMPSVDLTPAAAAAPAARRVPTTLAGALTRTKRHRRDYFGDYSPMTPMAAAAPADLDEGAEIYLLPRRDEASVLAQAAPSTAHARPGGTIVSLPRHTPLVASGSLAQR